MDEPAATEPDYSSALPDVNPAQAHQQVMSPNTASVTAVTDVQMPTQDAVMAAGNQGSDDGVAVRTMAVAVATGQSGGTPNWQAVEASPPERMEMTHERIMGAAEHSFGQMNAAQASWSVMAARRSAPAWIQRLGAFFQEMRSQHTAWPPSPLGSPPARPVQSQRGSPEMEQRGWGSPVLLSPEQQEQFRRMEQRAPLLYGPPRGERAPEGNGSSGGSTYEAVQEEVKRQLRGVVSQVEASRREAQDLRQEVEFLRTERGQAGPSRQLEDMVMPEGPPVTLGGYLTGQTEVGRGAVASSSTREGSGVQAGCSTTEASGLCAGSSTREGSGIQAAMPTNGASGLCAGSSTRERSGVSAAMPTTGASGLCAGASMGMRSGIQAGCPTTGVSGSHAGTVQQPSAAMTTQMPQSAAAITSGTTMGPGNATAGGSDPMSRLLEGLEKVIKGGKPEELSKAVDAPKLPEISESSSVDFGDWLYLIEHVMSDLSTSSAEWWATVVQDAQDFYEKYQAADQFSRLSMKPTASPNLSEARWSHLDRRGATILLGATPDDIKKELVATRTRTTLEVLARLMVIYRPGSALEKGQLLRRIESPEQATTVQEAIEGLRQWLRHYQRARDLKLSVPDPSVTLRGIDQLVKKPIQENPEVAFRMNLLRYHLKVDFSPAEESVLAVHRALLAEFEQMGFKKKGKQVQESSSTARVRALDSQQAQVPTTATPTSPSSTGKGARPCRFHVTDEGCRRGKACKYEHTMKDLVSNEKRSATEGGFYRRFTHVVYGGNRRSWSKGRQGAASERPRK